MSGLGRIPLYAVLAAFPHALAAQQATTESIVVGVNAVSYQQPGHGLGVGGVLGHGVGAHLLPLIDFDVGIASISGGTRMIAHSDVALRLLLRKTTILPYVELAFSARKIDMDSVAPEHTALTTGVGAEIITPRRPSFDITLRRSSFDHVPAWRVQAGLRWRPPRS